MQLSDKQKGFSLVELSIVLVILGLLTGGILTGQNLIRAAELRSVVTEYQRYTTAVRTFQDKYLALPGDMRNATDFWGSAGGTGFLSDATCRGGANSGTVTCNGDGDGQLGFSGVTTYGSEYGEYFTFWQHLANASLIEGNPSGIAGSGGRYHATADNTPKSKLGNAYWTALGVGPAASHATFFTNSNRYGDILTLGALTTSATAEGVVLSPEETWNIDTKIDDGKPAQGKVWAVSYATCALDGAGNVATATTADPVYNLSNSDIACSLIFIPGF